MLTCVIHRPSGLVLHMPKHQDVERIVTLPNGKRVRVHLDGSRTVMHIEENDALHARVRPKTHVIKMRGVTQ